LPLYHGAQIAVDTTLVLPLTASSQPRRRQGTFAGAALADARRSKERTYPELVQSHRCQLVVLGIEVGGRFSHESARFLRLLATARARSVPALLRSAAFVSRWSAMLTSAALKSFAASLLLEETAAHSNVDAAPPLLSDVLGQDGQAPSAPAVSRLAP